MSVSTLAKAIAESPTMKLNEEARLLRERGQPVIHLGIGEPKTKALKTRLDKLGYGSVLFVGGPELDQNFVRAARNLLGVEVLPQQGANVYDILRQDTLVLSKDAAKYLEERLA